MRNLAIEHNDDNKNIYYHMLGQLRMTQTHLNLSPKHKSRVEDLNSRKLLNENSSFQIEFSSRECANLRKK